MTRILSDNNSRILMAPQSDPLECGRGLLVQNYCHYISWEKATTTKMRLSKTVLWADNKILIPLNSEDCLIHRCTHQQFKMGKAGKFLQPAGL